MEYVLRVENIMAEFNEKPLLRGDFVNALGNLMK